jgi:hypothetical protein
MKSILSHIPVLVFCMLCINWQVFVSSPGDGDFLMVAGNNDSIHEGFVKPKIIRDDSPDTQMLSCRPVRILSPMRRFECNIHLPDFKWIPKPHFIPYLAIPPPVC